MYSGTTLTRFSGGFIGTHQKFDRIARKRLKVLMGDDKHFPSIKTILQFEGKNGPDGIKSKSPAHDEPWHYYHPFDDNDNALPELISDHFKNLVRGLKNDNQERAAFEAAWLAHALIDGLTPAHHYPYEEVLVELSDGQPISERTTLKKKLVMPGLSRRKQIKNNWLAWGPKGLRTAHGLFEMGTAAIVAPLRFGEAVLTEEDIEHAKKVGAVELFKLVAKEIAAMGLYETYVNHGWTPRLASQVRHTLGPAMIRTVTLVWYLAVLEAEKVGDRKPQII